MMETSNLICLAWKAAIALSLLPLVQVGKGWMDGQTDTGEVD